MKFLANLFTDDAGNVSSTRAVMLLSFAVILTGWLIVSLETRTLQNLPDSLVSVLAATLAAKVGQKFSEAKPPAAGPAPAPSSPESKP